MPLVLAIAIGGSHAARGDQTYDPNYPVPESVANVGQPVQQPVRQPRFCGAAVPAAWAGGTPAAEDVSGQAQSVRFSTQARAASWLAPEPVPLPPVAPEPILRSQGEPVPATRPVPRPLELPPDLPGSSAPDIHLPPLGAGVSQTQRDAAISRLYEKLPVAEVEFPPPSAAEEHPLTLCELEQTAVQQNPLMREAAADIQTARGNAIQASAYPNPTMGWEADNINTGGTDGYQGGFINQQIVTAGKLKLARAAAEADVRIAELKYQSQRISLVSQVRSQYYAVLVALERIRIFKALDEFANRTYTTQIQRVKGGEAAPYEPLLLRVAAVQARAQRYQAQHAYAAAWRQLAATLSCPSMAPRPLAGRLDGPIPRVEYDEVLAQTLRVSPDLMIAVNQVMKDQYNLKLARVTPIPNLTTNTVVQHDYTTPPFGTTVNLQLSVPIPVFDRNRGGILAADGTLNHDCQERDRIRNDLVNTLADAYNRYQSNHLLVDFYRSGILAQQIVVYRGTYRRHQEDPDAVGFNDVVTAQQLIATNLQTYVQSLSDQWQAVIDLARLLQADDLYRIGPPMPVAEIPSLAPGS
jgi:cobalt-zinc-cadmium efflux system outer membrane protein